MESESIFVHTNETTFVTGESILYKIYCLNNNTNQLSSISKIAYIELIDSTGTSIHRSKISLNNGVGNNEIFINTNYNTGNYKLISYTNWMQNNSKFKYFELDIVIINPFIPYDINKNDTNKTTINSSNELTRNNDFELDLEKKKYSKREKVELNLKTTSDKFYNGNYSISIRKIDGLKFANNNSAQNSYKNENFEKYLNSKKIDFLPELRGELFSGKIQSNDKNSQEVEKHIALSIIGDPFDFKIVKTNKHGEFNFILNKEINNPNAFIQILEDNINEYNLQISEASKVKINTTFKNNLHISNSSISDIENRLVASQIVNAYNEKEELKIRSKEIIPFYKYNAKEYILDDYKRFPSFKETILEIIPAVYFKEENGEYTLHIRDYVTSGDSFGKALVIIDGMLLQNVSELFNYNTSNIYKIDVINKAYSYGSKIFSGVIAITTFDREYISKSKNILPIQIERCISKKEFQNYNYNLDQDLTRIPDYRYQLAWEANFKMHQDSNRFIFYTSDIEGQFEISFEGFASNGEPISIKETFEVN